MDEDRKHAAEAEIDADTESPKDIRAKIDFTSWGNLWQVPAILLSLLLIALGVMVTNRRAPVDDFDRVLDQVDEFISATRFDAARHQLLEVIEPNLPGATVMQEARYHATVADWVAISQQIEGATVPANNRLIDEQYGLARELRLSLSPARLERWANALIDLDRLDESGQLLAELEGLGLDETLGAESRLRRNRLLRRLVECRLLEPDLSYDATMALLDRYRQDVLLGLEDRAWVARQFALLRLESGEANQAVERLLIDMRRLQTREIDEGELPVATWGTLYTLLARGYIDLGQFETGRFHLEAALSRLTSRDAMRGEALLLSGRIDLALDDPDQAHERFSEVIRDFSNTNALAAATLERAHVRGVLGDHAGAMDDYRAVITELPGLEPRRDVTPLTVAAGLVDRHDAALVTQDLDVALEYVAIAETIFETTEPPVDLLWRIASTSRQIADDMLTRAMDAESGDLAAVAPETRQEARERYRKAGGYFMRHARALTATPDSDEAWAQSLWLAGDSYDLAGDRNLSIQYFREYIAGRSAEDPRRAEVTYRLGQALHAEIDYAGAAETYEQLMVAYPRSTEATKSHVPLARCYVALGRAGDAEHLLEQVIDGRQNGELLLTPEALDYRNALIELGRLLDTQGQTSRAIERLSAAVERYPDDHRIHELRYRLADCYRRRARDLFDQTTATERMSPAERQARVAEARRGYEQAMSLFDDVVRGYDETPPERLNRMQRDQQRFATLYRGDCAFELEQYDLALAHYDEAARRYSSHHVSMQALVQIVNCFERLGDMKAADIAHQNALLRLRQLPDTTFDDPHALMDRIAWERWLESRPLGASASAESSSTETQP